MKTIVARVLVLIAMIAPVPVIARDTVTLSSLNDSYDYSNSIYTEFLDTFDSGRASSIHEFMHT